MSLYIVQVYKNFGTLIGYLAHGRVVSQRRNATAYSSPSAAESAARAFVFATPGHCCRVMRHRGVSRGA